MPQTPVELSGSGLCKVCGNEPCWSLSLSPQLKEKLSEMKRDASELQTMHHYHRILSLCRGWCAAVCSVCSQSWSPAPAGPDTAWCHDAMMSAQTDVMPVSTSGRHSHDVMQTEHYPGMNYCYENNQVRRIIRIIKYPRHIIHQMYILLIRQLS